jgi:hypothetical protein
MKKIYSTVTIMMVGNYASPLPPFSIVNTLEQDLNGCFSTLRKDGEQEGEESDGNDGDDGDEDYQEDDHDDSSSGVSSSGSGRSSQNS